MFLAMFMRIALLFGINLIDSNERTLVYYRFKVVVKGNYGTKYHITSGWFVPYLQEHQRNQRKK
jgi:hypothetical protein